MAYVPDGRDWSNAGQLGFFHKFAGAEIEIRGRANGISTRQSGCLAFLDGRLAGRSWIMGRTIRSRTSRCGLGSSARFLRAKDVVGYDGFRNIDAWMTSGTGATRSQAASNIPDREGLTRAPPSGRSQRRKS